MTEPVRLSKLMTERGLCSRREADRYIKQGLVYVDGEKVTTLGTRIERSQGISLDSRASSEQSGKVTVLVNKPAGYVSGLPQKGYRSAVMLIEKQNRFDPEDAVPNRKGLAPAGRLDIDSTGLMVFTQDGRIAKTLIGPDNRIEKEYLVWVKGQITSAKIVRLRHGLELDGRLLRPAKVERIVASRLRFVLVEGRKRQIRRMCEQVDLTVTRLVRVRIGRIELGKLGRGQWRLLQPGESF